MEFMRRLPRRSDPCAHGVDLRGLHVPDADLTRTDLIRADLTDV